jgi:hypothetical protein
MEPEKNTINIIWDPEKQAVGLKFNNADFKTWTFVVGVLQMAVDSANERKEQAQMVAAMQQQAQAQQMGKIIQNIRG